MTGRPITIALTFTLLCFPLLFGCGDDNDDDGGTGPGSPFPALYRGTYQFALLPIQGELEFYIQSEQDISGTWTGQDATGAWWHLSVTGFIQNGELQILITGYYDDSQCAIAGEALGNSTDEYKSFDGSWSLIECHNLGFQGTWDAMQVDE